MPPAESDIKLLPPSTFAWAPARPVSKQIAVLTSGGVDSSVAAHLLRQAGRDVLAVTMLINSPDRKEAGTCCGADAALVCHQLGISHYFIDVRQLFAQLIVEPFRQAYAAGFTPNPCADCNSLVKFGLVWDFLRQHFGISRLATGHYARIVLTGSSAGLARAADKSRDQSYFLYGIAADRLGELVFPVGELTKKQVRSTAARLGLCVADKEQSMELCFAGQADYRAILAEAGANRPGDITDMKGTKIGTHKGIANYTIGQRRGLGYAGGKPLYVGRIDPAGNTIALGTRQQVSSRLVKADRLNVLISGELSPGSRLAGKIRSYGEPHPCRVAEVNADSITVEFDQPQFAPCPGQRLVLYNSCDQIVAGGIITSLSV
jgi:tRNA-specific 2-thiouridylase